MHAPLAKSDYSHCRSIQRDLSSSSEQDVDYLDLFGDSKRSKMYVEYTLACAADCLRLHPDLMEPSWNSAHASRDAKAIWELAQADVHRFNEMIDVDGASLSDGMILGIMWGCQWTPGLVWGGMMSWYIEKDASRHQG